jgi:hypothetical protein
MQKKHIYIILAVLVVLVGAVVADVVSFKKNGGHDGTNIIENQEKNTQSIVEAWIQNSAPTYVFDGLNLKFIESKEGECAGCFTLTFTFESNHGGYGDREGLSVTEAITPHAIEIGVEKGGIKSAITDGKYNEFTGALAE